MPAGSIRCCDPYPDPMATFVRSTSGTGFLPPNMCLALPIWLNTWSAATHRKSGYMNSTTGRNRPSSASPPPRPGERVLADRGAEDAARVLLGQALGRAVGAAAELVHVLAEHDDPRVGAHPPVHHRRHRVDELPAPQLAGERRALGGPRPRELRQVAADADVDERRVGPQLGADAPRARPSRRAPGRARRAPRRPPSSPRRPARARRRRRPRRSARAWSSPARPGPAGRGRATRPPPPWSGSRTRTPGTGRSGGRTGRRGPR